MTTGVESVREVLDAARLVEESLADSGEPDEYVLEGLVRVASLQLDDAEAAGRQGFEAVEADDEDSEAGVTECLTAVVAQISIGNTLIAAGRAAGEGPGAVDAAQYSTAVTHLADTADVLGAIEAEAAGRQGFESAGGSLSVDAAMTQLRATAERVSEDIAGAAADTVTEAFRQSVKLVPEKLREAVQKISDRIELGDHAGRLVKLGLRAVRRAIELFMRLFPAEALVKVRDQVQQLYERMSRSEPAPATVGWIIGVEDVRKYLEVFAAGGVDQLDKATAEVERLGTKFADLSKLASGLIQGIALAGAAVAVLQLGVPQLPLVIAGALAVVVAGLLLFAMDYVGDRPALRTVRGVKLVVADAAG